MASPSGPDSAVYVISVAAELTGLHPQTLRTYERLGLITPGRTGGGGRRYSPRDIELLHQIAALTSEGIGIEGVRRILELEHRVEALQSRNAELGDEVTQLREALAQALGQTSSSGEKGEERGAARRPSASREPSTLPVPRRDARGRSVVVWRRGGTTR